MATTQTLQLPRASLLALEHEVLKLAASGTDISAALDVLCWRVESIAGHDVVATILTVSDGRLYPIAGPSMPEAYSRALQGAPIGPAVGSCGTAAWRGEPVEVHNIRRDPLWRDYLYLPLPDDLVACWSSPIKSRSGRVIGTFAFYFREERGASDLDRMIVNACVHLCALVIENDMARAELQRLAFEDSLTGLLNRAAFHERARSAIGQAAAGGAGVAFHIIDVDEFKSVNDALGHQVGDQLLAGIAERLAAAVGDAGKIARLGGDEFAVLQPDAGREAAADLAWRLLDAFGKPFPIEEHQVSVDASIGIAIAGEDGAALSDVLRNADLALYRAKAEGRGRHHFFSPELGEVARGRRTMGEDLRRAMDENELVVVYQPLVDLGTGTTVGCEALMRWQSRSRGEVMPATFIPLAEDMGLIGRLGIWALQEAVMQVARWPERMSVSVNISPVQLRSPSFAEDALRIVTSAGVSPTRVTLEITETAVLNDDDTTRQILLALKRMGFVIALDDFGTGYSSLKALRAIAIDKIKIDKSFVGEFKVTEASTTIVRAIVAMAQSLGLTTTAEGVESAERARQLAEEGCDEGQGYHFSPPLGAEDALAHVQKTRFDFSGMRRVAVGGA